VAPALLEDQRRGRDVAALEAPPGARVEDDDLVRRRLDREVPPERRPWSVVEAPVLDDIGEERQAERPRERLRRRRIGSLPASDRVEKVGARRFGAVGTPRDELLRRVAPHL